MGCAIQEVPQSRCFDEYNKKYVKGNALLEPCFGICCLDFALLSHSHFGICAKAFRGAAPWNMQPIPLPNGTVIKICDGAGKLTLECFRDQPSGLELAWLCDVGHLCEVLDGKIEQEEPTAAAVIICPEHEERSRASHN